MKKSLAVIMAFVAMTSVSHAESKGGGGGDHTEVQINDIREDILSWINKGGAKPLNLPNRISYEIYEARMRAVLAPNAVIIGSISVEQERATLDPDLKVAVDGQPKTCRGSIWKKDGLRHIVCVIERFAATPETDRYPLIHHEYAGLVNLEKNIGASSDYQISSQLSGYLQWVEVPKLSIKPQVNPSKANGCYDQQGYKCVDHAGLFEQQTFDMLTDLKIVMNGATYFVNGRALPMGRIPHKNGTRYCHVSVSTDSTGRTKLMPREFVGQDGSVVVPKSIIDTLYVSDLGWYTSDVHLASNLKAERLSLSIVCGEVKNQTAVDSKGTSLEEMNAALGSIFRATE